jgi:hypothetical protein
MKHPAVWIDFILSCTLPTIKGIVRDRWDLLDSATIRHLLTVERSVNGRVNVILFLMVKLKEMERRAHKRQIQSKKKTKHAKKSLPA